MENKKIKKISNGYVAQTFEKKDGKFVCTDQEFITGDQCDYEDMDGNCVDEPDEIVYQPFDMVLPEN